MADMTSNRAIAELIFGKMIDMGFTPYDIEYGNGYFLFDFGEDSVVHFRVKGVSRHWKFGLWLFADKLNEIRASDMIDFKNNPPAAQLFAQWDTQIDKFKPSASEIGMDFTSISMVDYEKDSECDWSFRKMGKILRSLRRHPFMAYAGAFSEYHTYFDESYIWYFIKNEWTCGAYGVRDFLSKVVWMPYMTVKLALARLSPGIDRIDVENFEKENPGLLTTYLYGISLTFPEHTTDQQDETWIDRWFKRDRYGWYRGGFDLYKLKPVIRKVGVDGERMFTSGGKNGGNSQH